MTDDLLKNLKLQGFKSTKIRSSLIDILNKYPTPLSVPQILDLFKKKGLHPNKTTLYREIAFLKDLGLVDELELQEREKRYELKQQDHHHHLVCVKCKSIQDIPMSENLHLENEDLFKKLQFKPLSHSLEFFGLCKNCQ